MNTSRLQPADTVECNVRGRHFLATFKRRDGRWFWVEPLSKSITYRRLKARQIVGKVERQGSLGVGV